MSAIFGELLNFPQEQGPEVRLRVFGDERYARYEDIDGYTMVYDKARGLFCYAALAGNRPEQALAHLDAALQGTNGAAALARGQISLDRARALVAASSTPTGTSRSARRWGTGSISRLAMRP